MQGILPTFVRLLPGYVGREEPRLAEPGLRDLSRRDYSAVVRRAVKKFNADQLTNIAAALAYYAFL